MSFLPYSARSKDVQDGVERHIWHELKYEEAGSTIKVKGTDTEDEEAVVLNIGGAAFKLKKDHDAEVFLLSSSSDTQLKVAVLTVPHDKQRRWPENEGGIQHPTDDEFALHFSDKLAHITKNKFAVGEKGEFEIRGDEIYIRNVKKVIIDAELIVNKIIRTPVIASGKEKIPDFQGNKQEEKKKSSGSGGSQPVQFELDLGDAA